MTNTNNQQFNLDNIKFVQDLLPETAANYSGGCGTSTATEGTSTSISGNQQPSFNSNQEENLDVVRSNFASGATPFIDFETWSKLQRTPKN